MECQNCHENEATVHYTEVVNGQKKEIHLCNDCAQKDGYMDFSPHGLSMHQLLTSIFPFDQSVNTKQNIQKEEPLTCDQCGTTYQEFRQRGKFGCDRCYETFTNSLDPIFKRVHSGNTEHVGRIPKRIGGDLHKKRELDELKKRLHQAIDKEDFETAAELRDEIQALKEKFAAEKKEGDA